MKNNQYEVIVIGLGAMGSSASYYLSKKGIKVLGIDRFHPPHNFGSSHGHTRVIREAYHEGTSYVPIVQRAYELWHELENESNQELIIEYGGLYIGDNGNYLNDAKLSAEKYNIPLEEFSATKIKENFRILNPKKNFTGLFEKRSGAVFPERSISYLINKSIDNGAVHKYNEKVISWKKESSCYKVITDKNEYLTEKIIFSSGAWIKNLLPSLNLPLKIERQVLFWFAPKDNKELFDYSNLPNTGWDLDNGKEFYTQPNIEGKGFKVAMHHDGEFIEEENLIREYNKKDLDIIRNFLEEYIPSANGKLLNSKVCIYTDTPDLDFIIDYFPEDQNIIACSPCSGHGFKFTPAIGEICSNMINNEKIKFDLSEFSLSRFL